MIAFSLWPVHIYRYGIMYLLGFAFGYLGFRYIAKKKYFAIKFPRIQHMLDKQLEDFLIVLFIGVLAGWRLGHVIIYNLQYYLAHPGEIVAFRDGWMSFIGGLFGVVISILVFWMWNKNRGDMEITYWLGDSVEDNWGDMEKINPQSSKKISPSPQKSPSLLNLLVLFDILLLLLPIGIALGRLGNYLNQELYGVLVSDWLPRLGYPLFSILHDLNIFHIYPAVDSFLRVNTNWLALLFEGLVTFVLGLVVFRHQIRRKLWHPWLWSAIFLIRYSFVRFFLEYLRADSQLEYRGPFTISQRFFVIFFILGILFLRRSIRAKNK